MTETHKEDIRKHVKTYYVIGSALFVLTVVTVVAAWVQFGVAMAVTVALLIAILKGSMVALFFMHLSHKKTLIYSVLLLTFAFFFVLLFMPLFFYLNSYEIGPLYDVP